MMMTQCKLDIREGVTMEESFEEAAAVTLAPIDLTMVQSALRDSSWVDLAEKRACRKLAPNPDGSGGPVAGQTCCAPTVMVFGSYQSVHQGVEPAPPGLLYQDADAAGTACWGGPSCAYLWARNDVSCMRDPYFMSGNEPHLGGRHVGLSGRGGGDVHRVQVFGLGVLQRRGGRVLDSELPFEGGLVLHQ